MESLGHLVVIAGPDQGRTFTLLDGQTLRIGRGQATETMLNDPQVSRVHCRLEVDGGAFRLVDQEGAGGTFVNGRKVDRHDLSPGDVVRIGGTQLRLQLDPGREQSTVMAPPPAPKVASPKAAEALKDLVGTTLAYYEVGPVLAKSRSGLVFRGRDTRDGKAVALKVLGPEFASDEEDLQRFIRAVKTVVEMKLHHPNLVSLYGAGKHGPHCWTAMELVEGESLTKVIDRIGTIGMLDWRFSLQVATQVARALEAAHEKQIIHRNVTPENILIREADKAAKLGDLVLAKAMEGILARPITRPGELVGDLAYMSPERTRGDAHVDTRSDIYSLGATVYALLTGRPPFEGGSLPETIRKIRQDEPAKPKKFQMAIPDLLEGAVLRMLAKRPEDRYPTPTELVRDLERIAKFQGMTV
ncbi:MAG TPA: FHA domain-containing serine/threonine-protein kinase [Isosphaeraceae bacterium]|jgi:serine/threonine protein kinase|nr:FHA domain-containing serine/threonine-protein kinase [Isosphaeraceae bacterium]